MTRSFSRPTLAFALVTLAAMVFSPSQAEAKWRPQKASIDTRFGSTGWATLALPRNTAIDATDDLYSSTAGPHGTYFVSTSLEGSSKAPDGVVLKYNRRGQLVKSFGRNGRVIPKKKHLPASVCLLDDGSMILTSAIDSKSGATHWALTRLRSDGSRVKDFGTNGSIKFRIPDAGNKDEPMVAAIAGARFGVVLRDFEATVPDSRLTVFDRSGKPARSFGNDGVLDFDFSIDSVSAAGAGQTLVAGNDGLARIVRLNGRGNRVRSWGDDGMASLGRVSRKTASFGGVPTSVQATAIGSRVMVTFDAETSNMDYADNHAWAQRLTPRGFLDRRWGINGRRHTASSSWTSEGDGSANWFNITPTTDGRVFTADYFVDDYGDYTETTYSMVGRSGKKRSTGSRRYVTRSFDEAGHSLSRDGKYLYAFGYRGKRPVVVRFRF